MDTQNYTTEHRKGQHLGYLPTQYSNFPIKLFNQISLKRFFTVINVKIHHEVVKIS